MFILSMILTILFIMVVVAYLTLMEWKILSYIQLRKGPNSVGFIGILQPFSGAVKLFLKEHSMPLSNYMIYIISPIIGLFIGLMLWSIYPFIINCCSFILVFYFFSVVLEWVYME